MRYEHLPDDLIIDIDIIDRDHDQLFCMVDMFRNSSADRNFNVLKTIAMGLVEYTIYHFMKEEIAFGYCGYADTVSHAAEHRKLEAVVQQIIDDLEDRPEMFDAKKFVELDQFFIEWLNHHIRKCDMAYIETFRASPAAMSAIEELSFCTHLNQGIEDVDPLGDILDNLG
jgi:hemerythrin-like metal-binding protein